jgi:hypothetical protein
MFDVAVEPSIKEPEKSIEEEKWEALVTAQGKKTGRCQMCGSRRVRLVNLKFEDHFGVAEREMCYKCFKKHSSGSIL